MKFFEAAAQMLPLLVITLVVEARLISDDRHKDDPKLRLRRNLAWIGGLLYAGVGGTVCLLVLYRGRPLANEAKIVSLTLVVSLVAIMAPAYDRAIEAAIDCVHATNYKRRYKQALAVSVALFALLPLVLLSYAALA